MKRAMAVAVLAMCLSSCSDMPKTWRKSEIEAIANERAEDFADAGSADVANELAGQINQLEQRIDQLESENADLELRISNLELYQ